MGINQEVFTNLGDLGMISGKQISKSGKQSKQILGKLFNHIVPYLEIEDGQNKELVSHGSSEKRAVTRIVYLSTAPRTDSLG